MSLKFPYTPGAILRFVLWVILATLLLSTLVVIAAAHSTWVGANLHCCIDFIAIAYPALLAITSIVCILLMGRLLVHPEPESDYRFPRMAGWWPVPQVVLAIFYLVLLINAYALTYWFVALREVTALSLPAEEKINYWTALYFSVTTFTTTGYGDITPGRELRGVAATEMLVGYIVFGMFVAGAYQLLTRPASRPGDSKIHSTPTSS